MRSLLPPPARTTRRRLGSLAVAMLLPFATACDWITGVPSVDRVEVSVTPRVVAVGSPAQATGAAYRDDGRTINSPKVPIGYSSDNPSVATVNPTTGAIVAVAPGVAHITATARSKKGTDSIVVVPAPPAFIDIQQVNVFVGSTVPLGITLRDQAGQTIPARAATIVSSNPSVVEVVGQQKTDAAQLRGVSTGNATITVDVGGKVQPLQVTVFPRLPSRVTLGLAGGGNQLIEGQTAQSILTLYAPDNTTIPPTGHTIACTSDDATVATVQPTTCLVQALRAGTTVIRVTVAGSVTAFYTLTVVQLPADEVRIVNRNQFVRLDANGVGVPSIRTAIAIDSVGRTIVNRSIAYRSTDPSVFTVSSATGTVVAQKLGQARLIASADNGRVADTLLLTVTPVPIAVVTVRPQQVSQIYPGQTQQFTATLTDSLGATVSGRTIQWFSNTPTVMSINQTTGLGTAVGAGTATITAQAEIVPGFPGTAQVQTASVLVLPTPIAKIDVSPTTVDLKVGAATIVSIVVRDAAGNQLFGRTNNVNITSTNPAVAIASQDGTIRGISSGTTTITYQGVDQSLNPQGAPTVITVTVSQ